MKFLLASIGLLLVGNLVKTTSETNDFRSKGEGVNALARNRDKKVRFLGGVWEKRLSFFLLALATLAFLNHSFEKCQGSCRLFTRSR